MLSFTPDDLSAVRLSLQVACAATVITLPLGIAVAYVLTFARFPGKAVLEGVINLPLVLPPVVTGYLLLLLFGSKGWIGSLLVEMNVRVVFTLAGAVIASSVVGFPLLVRSIRTGMEALDSQFVQASRALGATWWDSLATVVIPLSGRAILAGMTLMFARSLGEFGATIVLAGNIPGITQTIPLAIYQYTGTPGGDQMALSLCAVSIGLSFTVLLAGEAINRKITSGTHAA